MSVEAHRLAVWLRLHRRAFARPLARPLALALFPDQAKTKERGVDVRGEHYQQRRAYRVEVCGYRRRLRQEKPECRSRTGAARQEELEEEAVGHGDRGRMDWARRSCAGIFLKTAAFEIVHWLLPSRKIRWHGAICTGL